jgi:hypothetical protein
MGQTANGNSRSVFLLLLHGRDVEISKIKSIPVRPEHFSICYVMQNRNGFGETQNTHEPPPINSNTHL